MTDNAKFDQWAIIELFGHQRVAGRVTEQTIGGASFIRVDVPGCDGRAGFTRMFGSAAIYAINPVDEAIARQAAGQIGAEPINPYAMRHLLEAHQAAAAPLNDAPHDYEDEL